MAHATPCAHARILSGAWRVALKMGLFSSGKGFGYVDVIGARTLVGIYDVKFAQNAKRRVGVVRSNSSNLLFPALADEIVQCH